MVDRFLHGLDEPVQDDINRFCTDAVRTISKNIVESTGATDEEAARLNELARKAEEVFLNSLKTDVFTKFKERSLREIESMVEFMPKPELARMAEALIDLTSIKRRVSQEMETVGGPVDVALISKNDGFVWVRRKHYFPPALNSRYFHRNGWKTTGGEGHDGNPNDA